MPTRKPLSSVLIALGAAALALCPRPAGAQLFDNLQALGSRLDTGDPEVISQWEEKEGPKGLAAGDLDGDHRPDLAVSNLDGTVTVYYNQGAGDFSPPFHLRTGTQTLRDVIIADLTADGVPDVAAASIVDGVVVVFRNLGGRAFADPASIPTWTYARDLAAGDFNGDGVTDLAVAGCSVGLRQLNGHPDGTFTVAADFERFVAGDHSKPVFSLAVTRPAGADRDELMVTHAWSSEACVLGAGESGVLEVKGCVAGVLATYDLEVGAIATPADSGIPDLVTVHRDLGVLQVRRGTSEPARFEEKVHVEVPIPGGPRSAKILDLDGDGWNDIAVVLRNLDRVLSVRNEEGVLRLANEMPVGTSPREVAAADFDGDGQPDLAVVNRVSADVSLLISYPDQVGFSALDQLYLVDGEIRQLRVHDFNGDGRDDVLLLHGASGDISLRTSRADGSLEPPQFFSAGLIPADLDVQDVNNDGRGDMVVVSLGSQGVEKGSISVRLGEEGGSFGPERRFPLPVTVDGSLFAVEVADFNGDGHLDAVAGYMDCRLSFFSGTGDGTFVLSGDVDHAPHVLFGYEIRSMAAGDFDRDGDIDLAGASLDGHLVVAENHGAILSGSSLDLTEYRPAVTLNGYPTGAMVATDLNQDGDLDLLVGSGVGAVTYHGAAGMSFIPADGALPGTAGLPASSVADADFDSDGDLDIAVSCKVLSCIIILTRNEQGDYLPALTVDVPAGGFIAAGDLDGDSFADLVGSGEVLWTALSSRRARPGEPPTLEDTRQRIAGVVINELLAANNNLPLAQNGGRKSDWIELYNGLAQPVSLAGGRLSLEVAGVSAAEFIFPSGTQIEGKGHLLVAASRTPGDILHTGFRIPAEGGVLTLIGPGGGVLDRVPYPPQLANVSYARFRDSLPSFAHNPFPGPGDANVDNGPVPPQATLLAAVPESAAPGDPLRALKPGQAIRLFAGARDDVGILSLSALYRRVDRDGAEPRRVFLFDDGMNGDGAMQDGFFSGVIEEGIPAGGAIELHLEAMDLSGVTVQVPEDAFFAPDPALELNYRLGVSTPPALEISELVARNTRGLQDEGGARPDWVEVRNCSAAPVSLAGVAVGGQFPAHELWFGFPAERTLLPGEAIVVLCDENLKQGQLHAPFRLSAEGGRVVLVWRSPEGGNVLVDAIDYGPQEQDVAFGRPTCGGVWQQMAPTPGAPNPELSGAWGDADLSRRLDITDAIVVLQYLFLGESLACPRAADANVDSRVNITDPIHLLDFLFRGGPAPPTGWTSCGS